MKKVLALVLALAMVMMMFVACKKEEVKSSSEPQSSVVSEPGKSSTAGGEYDAYSLACLYSEITGDFWSVVYNGCKAALEELKASGVEGLLRSSCYRQRLHPADGPDRRSYPERC